MRRLAAALLLAACADPAPVLRADAPALRADAPVPRAAAAPPVLPAGTTGTLVDSQILAELVGAEGVLVGHDGGVTGLGFHGPGLDQPAPAPVPTDGLLGRRPPATVQLGEPILAGDLDKAVLRRLVRQRFAELRFCYERRLAASPALAGELVLSFPVAADGSVGGVSVTSGLDAEVDACVGQVVARIRFPTSLPTAVHALPIVFAPPPSDSR